MKNRQGPGGVASGFFAKKQSARQRRARPAELHYRRLAIEPLEARRLLAPLVALWYEFDPVSGSKTTPPAQTAGPLVAGQKYMLDAYIQDARGAAATGLETAYINFTYDPTVISLVGGVTAPDFPNDQDPQLSSGAIDQVGGFTNNTNPTNPSAVVPFFSVEIQVAANLTGTQQLALATSLAPSSLYISFLNEAVFVNTISQIGVNGLNSTLNTTTNTWQSTIAVVANQAPSTTSLKSSANPAVYGQPVTFTATVAPTSGSGAPTGSVTFMDGATSLSTVSLVSGTATFTDSSLAAGAQSITAVYNGDSNFGDSTSNAIAETVNQAATTTSVASAANPAVFGQAVSFTATVTATAPGAGTPTGTVSFKDGSATLGTVALSGNTASFSTSSLAVASHTITAVYNSDTNFTGSTSSTLAETVNHAATTTSVTTSLNPSTVGQSVTFTATVSPVSPGAGTATGNVTFMDGLTSLGTAALTGGKTTFSISSLAVGSHSITAVYGGDGNFTASPASPAVTQVVNKAASTTNVVSSANPAVFGQAVTFKATVAPTSGSGTPTGSVTFMDGLTSLSTVTLSGGAASFTASSLAIGTHSITAVYNGDSAFSGSTSGAIAQVINQAATTTSVASAANPAVFGQAVIFTATVTATAPGAGTPTGTVSFMDGSATLGTVTLSGGAASFSTSSLAVAAHSITAVYNGGANFTGSTSNILAETVNRAATTTSVTASPNPSTLGQSVSFTATVSAMLPGAGTATGSVTFMDGSTSLGTAALTSGKAVFSISTLSVGSHNITAVYGGDGNFATSTSSPALTQVVSPAASTTSVVSSANPAVFGQGVTFTATVAPASGSGTLTGSVTFMDGATSLSTVSLSSGTATFTASSLATGTHSITAVYNGDSNFKGSTSNAIAQAVNQAATTTSVASAANPAVFGQAVSFTATVTATAPGVGTPTGTVSFQDGTTTLGTVPLSGGAASFTTSSLTMASHNITAVYNSDTNFAGSISSALAQTVNRAATTTSLSTATNPSTLGQSVTFTATVSAVSPGAGTATGSVTFMDGSTTLGTASVTSGKAVFSISSLAVGSHSIAAVYGGDGNFTTSTSSPALTQVVNKAATTTSVTATLSPSTLGQSVTFTATISAVPAGVGAPTGSVTFMDGSTSLGSAPLAGGTAIFSTSSLTVGSHNITAVYGGDGNFAASTSSPALTQVVNKAATTASVTATLNPATFGQPVILTATVAAASSGLGTATGSVTFMDGTTTLGTAPLTGGTATFSTSSLAIGSHSITVVYGGDANFAGSTSSPALTLVVSPWAATTSLSVAPAGRAVFGTPVILTATVVAAPPATGVPTGSVTFMDTTTNTSLGTIPLTGGTATFNASSLAVGSYTFTAVYDGDTNFGSSASGPASYSISKASAAITALTAAPTASVFGQAVTFTAVVAAVAPSTATPTGSVDFMEGATKLGTGALSNGTATLNYSLLDVAGSPHAITAVYDGDANFNGATTTTTVEQSVTQAATTTTIVSSANPSVAGQSTTLTITVSAVSPGAGTPTGTVTLSGPGGPIALASNALVNGSLTYTTSFPSVGSTAFTATYGGDANFQGSASATLTQTIKQAATTTTLSAVPNPSAFGQAVTFTATVAAQTPGSGTPTGSVTFMDGTTSLGAVSLTNGTAVFSTSSLGVASHIVTAVYAGDTNYTASTSTSTVTQVVNKANTATSLTAAPNATVFGQSLTFTATVAASLPGAGLPTGNVDFMQGTTKLGSGTLNSGTATFSDASLAVGSQAVTAVYDGDANFADSTSGPASYSIGKASASISTLTAAPTATVYGQAVSFTAVVAAVAPSTATPTGNVDFMEGATKLGSGTLNNGTATFAYSLLDVAGSPHLITAVYDGDANFNGVTTTTTVEQSVTQAATTISIVSAANPSVVGQAVTFTATVSVVSPGAGTPTGSVTFMDGTTSLGTASLTSGTAALSISSLALGSHNITAVYGGDANFTTSVSSAALPQVVNKAATATALTAVPSSPTLGQSVTFTATVSAVPPGAGTTTGSVSFMDGTTLLGTVPLTNGSAAFSTASLALGSHDITASYSGDANFNSSSGVLPQVVTKAATTTTLTAATSSSVFGQSVAFTATVSAASPGAVTPTGSVTFMDGTTTLGTGTLANGTATFSTPSLAVGSHGITAVYAGDTNSNPSTSTPALAQVVNKAVTTTSVTAANPSPSTFGQAVTLTAAVAPVSPGAGTPTGSVTFLDATTNTTLGTGTLTNGTATCSTAVLTAGQHHIIATYAGDANFNASSSSAAGLTQTVNQAATTASVTAAAPNPSTFGQAVTFTATVTVISPGAGTPTGSVTFLDTTTNTTLGTGTITNGTATFSTTALTAGQHAIAATYSGNANFSASPAANAAASQMASQTVAQAGSTVTVTSSPDPASPGQTVTLKAAVAAASPGAGTPTGSVTFLDATTNTTLGTANLNAGSATLPTSFATDGDQDITVTYSGDANFNSGSGTLTLPVIKTSSLSGYVYIDANDNGQRMIASVSKPGIAGVTITLVRTDATAPDQTAVTQSDGSYQFSSLPAGTYKLMETQPQQYLSGGKDTAGTLAGGTGAAGNLFGTGSTGNVISTIELGAGQHGTEYDFGEYLMAASYLANELELVSTPTAADPVQAIDPAPVVQQAVDLTPVVQQVVDPAAVVQQAVTQQVVAPSPVVQESAAQQVVAQEAVDSPPVVQLAGNSTTAFTASYAVGGSPVAIASAAATITQVGGSNLASLIVTITNLKDTGSEGFVLGNQTFNADTVSLQTATTLTSFPKITAAFAAGTLTLTGGDSINDYQSLLQSIQYEDTAASPDTSPRIITVVARDALAASNTAMATITIAPSAAASPVQASAVSQAPVSPVATPVGASMADQVLDSVDNWLGG